MTRFNSIDEWRNAELAEIDCHERALRVIGNLDGVANPIEILLRGANVALKDSADSVYVHYLGRAAFDIGLILGIDERPYTQEEVSSELLGLSQLGKIACDTKNLARYFHPEFLAGLATVR